MTLLLMHRTTQQYIYIGWMAERSVDVPPPQIIKDDGVRADCRPGLCELRRQSPIRTMPCRMAGNDMATFIFSHDVVVYTIALLEKPYRRYDSKTDAGKMGLMRSTEHELCRSEFSAEAKEREF